MTTAQAKAIVVEDALAGKQVVRIIRRRRAPIKAGRLVHLVHWYYLSCGHKFWSVLDTDDTSWQVGMVATCNYRCGEAAEPF
jgi:hypothetical protein